MNTYIAKSNEPVFWSPQTTAHMLDMSLSSLYRLHTNDSTFPRKIRLGKGKVGWSAKAIHEWVETRTDG